MLKFLCHLVMHDIECTLPGVLPISFLVESVQLIINSKTKFPWKDCTKYDVMIGQFRTDDLLQICKIFEIFPDNVNKLTFPSLLPIQIVNNFLFPLKIARSTGYVSGPKSNDDKILFSLVGIHSVSFLLINKLMFSYRWATINRF